MQTRDDFDFRDQGVIQTLICVSAILSSLGALGPGPRGAPKTRHKSKTVMESAHMAKELFFSMFLSIL